METYIDSEGIERCDNCDEPIGECPCICPGCGDCLLDCACSETEAN